MPKWSLRTNSACRCLVAGLEPGSGFTVTDLPVAPAQLLSSRKGGHCFPTSGPFHLLCPKNASTAAWIGAKGSFSSNEASLCFFSSYPKSGQIGGSSSIPVFIMLYEVTVQLPQSIDEEGH